MNGFTTTHAVKQFAILIVAGGLLAALVSASCAPAVDVNAAAATLTRLDGEWSKAAATKNADSIAAYYAEDAIAYPPNEPVVVGRPAARKEWASYFVDSTFTISWKSQHAEVAKSGDMGFTAGTYEDSFKAADGKVVQERGKYVCVWAKQPDGTWKAIHDIWNSDAK